MDRENDVAYADVCWNRSYREKYTQETDAPKGGPSVEIRPHLLVPLGYGRYARSDVITVLEPIEEADERGPGRRTRVFVEGRATPIVASRTETTILRDMVREPAQVTEARTAIALLEDVLEDLTTVGPLLRRSIKDEIGLDFDRIEKRIRRLIGQGADE